MIRQQRLSLVHRIAGVIALVILLVFWFLTVLSELIGNIHNIKMVKYLIPYGFIILIPALMIVGGTGFKMARKSDHPILQSKKKRMPLIALNGLVILIPCAFYLRYMAIHEQFGLVFILVQLVELIVGGVNICLLIVNIRAGIRLVRNKQKSMFHE